MAVKLYINNRLAVLDGVPSMPITKQFDDLTNPTSIKNEVSKTISLPATTENNRIFENIWRIDHINGLFDPSKRVPFILTDNGIILLSGYIKLTSIKKVGNTARTYEITLFGDIGGFFYYLQSKDMQDIVMPGNNLQHTINRNTIVNPPAGVKYFLSYQGKYDGFESGIEVDSDGNFIDLPQEFDEHQRNEFRSYYQRPAISVSLLMAQLLAQSGYDVHISNQFAATPYYNKSYLGLDYVFKSGDTAVINNGHFDYVRITDYHNEQLRENIYGEVFKTRNVGDFNANASFNLNTSSQIFANDGVFDISGLKNNDVISFNLAFKLIGGFVGEYPYRYNAASDKTSIIGRMLVDNADTGANIVMYELFNIRNAQRLRSKTNLEGLDVMYYVDDDGKTIEDFIVNLSIYKPANVNNIRIRFEIQLPECTGSGSSGGGVVFYFKQNNSTGVGRGTLRLAMNMNSYIKANISHDLRSNSTIEYSMMMPRGITQLDFVRNYFKAFGLLWRSDVINNRIHILTRNEYFVDYKIIDWTHKIDYSKDVSTNPIFVNYRFGLLSWNKSETYRIAQYLNRHGNDFGQMRLDTGFEFDNSEKKLLDDTTIRNALISEEYDHLFNGRNPEQNRDDKIIPAIYNRTESERERSSEIMQLLFWEGWETCSPYRISDDSIFEVAEQQFCWQNIPDGQRSNYPRMSRVTRGDNGELYSLDFSKPSQLYYPATDVDYPPESTIYRRFWSKYMSERLNSNTRVMTCYAYITNAEFASWEFNTFVKIENTLWHVNKIENFDPLKQQSTKVELVRVKDIEAYINGQNL